MCRAGALIGADLGSAVFALVSSGTVAARRSAEALVQVIRAHLGAARLQVILALLAFEATIAEARPIGGVTNAVPTAVVLAENLFTAEAGEAFDAGTVAIRASTMAMAVLSILARALIA